MNFNEKIQELRKNRNITQEKFAEMLNISRQAVAKWEAGETYPDLDNLILISNIFKVSLDRLLKNDSCSNGTNNENCNLSEIADFLIIAKKNTYAGNGCENKKSCRPHSHDLVFEKDNYKYFDTYLGGKSFIGEEVVFRDNVPVWGMNYYGNEINDKFSSAFLRLVLSNVKKDKPYRGPSVFKDGDYTYICSVEGTLECFIGKEEIFFIEEKVYECKFCGGIIEE